MANVEMHSEKISEMYSEVKKHLTKDIIPFWKSLRDDENGGYTGYLGYDLKADRKAVKGCILNSRITWFFALSLIHISEPTRR